MRRLGVKCAKSMVRLRDDYFAIMQMDMKLPTSTGHGWKLTTRRAPAEADARLNQF
jgi:hypothetical protein